MNDVIGRIGKSATIALLLSPVGRLLISVTRLLIISNYNPTTAMAIASSQGYLNTLLGTIIPLVPIFMPYLALLLLFSGRVIAGMLALLAAALISAPSVSRSDIFITARKDWYLISARTGTHHTLLVSMAFLFAGLLFAELIGFNFIVFIRTLGTVASLALIAIVVELYPLPIKSSAYVNPVTQPWLPAERITLTSHQDIIGYVISSDGYWLEVLISRSRTIQHYRMSDIGEREICQMNASGQNRPLIALEQVQVPIPLCSPPLAEPTLTWILPFLNTQNGASAGRKLCMTPVLTECQQSTESRASENSPFGRYRTS
jgi:hypothetical protein